MVNIHHNPLEIGTYEAWSVCLNKLVVPQDIDDSTPTINLQKLAKINKTISDKDRRLVNGISRLERFQRLPSERNLATTIQATGLETRKILSSVINIGLIEQRLEKIHPTEEQENYLDGTMVFVRGWELNREIICHRLNFTGLGLVALQSSTIASNSVK